MAKQTFTSGQTLTAAQMTTLQTNDFNMTVTTGTANYTLQASDVGQRRVQNMGSAGTVTVPNSVFTAGDALWIHSIGSGTQSIVAGAGMTLNSSAGTAPTLAQWEGGVVYFTSASAAIFFRGGGTTYGVATGGSSSSITVGTQAYTLLTFTSSSTLTVTKAGLFDVLLCGGGGAGGYNSKDQNTVSCGGGGAGGILQTTVYLDANQTVTIGAGGSTGSSDTETEGTLGNSVSIGSANGISVAGGGIGFASQSNQGFREPKQGGSGGGGGNHATATKFRNGAISMAPSVSGYAGGNGAASNTQGQGAGGGGGATAVGENASTTTGGAGGAGYDVSAFIGGSALFKCGGGGGGGTTGGAGGSSVGGAGGGADTAGTNASANTGGGGGGAGYAGATSKVGGNGGSGIIYIRFKV